MLVPIIPFRLLKTFLLGFKVQGGQELRRIANSEKICVIFLCSEDEQTMNSTF